jgi:hypothetical protein
MYVDWVQVYCHRVKQLLALPQATRLLRWCLMVPVLCPKCNHDDSTTRHSSRAASRPPPSTHTHTLYCSEIIDNPGMLRKCNLWVSCAAGSSLQALLVASPLAHLVLLMWLGGCTYYRQWSLNAYGNKHTMLPLRATV